MNQNLVNIKEEYIVNRLLAINFSLKVIQEVIFSINTYEQDIIVVGNKNKKMKRR